MSNRTAIRSAGIHASAFILMCVCGATAQAALVELSGVAQMEAGGKHACAVTTSGGAKCWGNNSKGQLGDGTTTNRSAANDVVGLTSGVAAVAASRGWDDEESRSLGHSCAVTVSGGIKCWGANDFGQLGDGTTTGRLTPVDVIGLPAAATAVATGWYHTCALLTGGALQCWGRNQSGELGDGTTTQRSTPASVTGLVGGVVEVAAGPAFTCVVTSGGGAKCWGSNQKGQLGDGTTADRLTPVDVGGLTSGVARVTVGGTAPPLVTYQVGGHACAITTAGGVKCWGFNDRGQLGEGTQNDHLTPFDVTGVTSGAVGVSAGGLRYRRTSLNFLAYEPKGHSCAVTSSGGVKCWGSDYLGKLGDGGSSDTSFSLAIPVNVAGLNEPINAVSAGGGMTCGLSSSGRVYCWGEGYSTSAAAVMSGAEPQTITFGPKPSIPVGGTGTVSATGGASGNPVVFSSNTPSICSVSGTTVSGLALGRCIIAANQAGNAYFDPAQATQEIPIGAPASQTIAFGPAPTVNVNTTGQLSANASSGLKVSFFSNTPSVCSVFGGTVTGLAAGSCTVTATQAGDDLYGPAPQVTQTFPVGASNGTFGLGVSKAGVGSGTVTSSPAGIDCGSTCAANFSAGTVVTLSATPAGDSYFSGWSGACTGAGACSVTMSAARTVTATFRPLSGIPRLANIATRGNVLTGDRVMIGGFIIGGSGPKTVVVRARGPSMAAQGVPNLLGNPNLGLYSGQTLIGSNDDWQGAANAAAISASGFAPSHSLESAILMTLNPGAYTAIVEGVGGTTGIGIVEIFEVDHPEIPLINIATRAHVGTGNDLMIGGFIIQGEGPQTVVIRARGPSLGSQGVPNTLANPFLQLFRGQNQLRANDDWTGEENAAQISASGFAPSNSLESAILMTLNPGAYTALVTSSGGPGNTPGNGTGTGIAIVEVFRVSQ